MITKGTSEQSETRSWISISLWGLFSAIGWAGGFYLITPLTGEALTNFGYLFTLVYEFVAGALLGTLTGMLVSVGQAQVLSRHGFVGTRWGRLTLIGMALGWGLGSGLSDPIALLFNLPALELLPVAVSGAIIAAIAGGTLGLCQYISLRRIMRRSGWWVMLSIVSWAVGGVVYWIVYRAAGGPFVSSNIHLNPHPALEIWPDAQTYYSALLFGCLAGGTLVGSFMAFGLNYILKNYGALRKPLSVKDKHPSDASSILKNIGFALLPYCVFWLAFMAMNLTYVVAAWRSATGELTTLAVTLTLVNLSSLLPIVVMVRATLQYRATLERLRLVVFGTVAALVLLNFGIPWFINPMW